MLDIFITSVLFPGLLCWGIFMGIVMAVGSVVYVVGREVRPSSRTYEDGVQMQGSYMRPERPSTTSAANSSLVALDAGSLRSTETAFTIGHSVPTGGSHAEYGLDPPCVRG